MTVVIRPVLESDKSRFLMGFVQNCYGEDKRYESTVS